MTHEAGPSAEQALPQTTDTLVIGAGQAGLVMSWWLKQKGREHVVIEAQEHLGGGWLKRWDSFCLVTPNWACRLPGFAYDGAHPDGYMSRDELVDFFVRYARSFAAPVVLGTRAMTLEPLPGKGFRVVTTRGTLQAKNVVVATGAFQVPRIPAASAGLPPGLRQLHTDGYRNERELPPGAVLIVGTGQSGCQVAEELHQAGRRVYLSVGSCWRAPRRYRGKDLFWWIAQRAMRAEELGIRLTTVDDLPSPRARFACNPQVSGKEGGHDIDLRRLGADGVTLLGRLEGAVDGRVRFAANLEADLKRADTFFDENLRRDIDAFIELAGIDAPAEPRPAFPYEPPIIEELNLAEAGISTLIWASGYRMDFDWIQPDIRDETGYPRHTRGVSETPGLYFLGLPWLYRQSSSLLMGVGQDAVYLSEHIAAQR